MTRNWEANEKYVELLVLDDGTIIPDPLANEWLSEAGGMHLWLPCMLMIISEYLIANNQQPLVHGYVMTTQSVSFTWYFRT